MSGAESPKASLIKDAHSPSTQPPLNLGLFTRHCWPYRQGGTHLALSRSRPLTLELRTTHTHVHTYTYTYTHTTLTLLRRMAVMSIACPGYIPSMFYRFWIVLFFSLNSVLVSGQWLQTTRAAGLVQGELCLSTCLI